MPTTNTILTDPNDVPRYSLVPHTRSEWRCAYRAAVTFAKQNDAVVAIDLPDGRVAHVSGQPRLEGSQMIERVFVSRW
jgi:hypothetical protein